MNRLGMALFALVLLLAIPGTASAISADPASADFGSVALNVTVTQDVSITVDGGFQVDGGLFPGLPWKVDVNTCTAFTGPDPCDVKVSFTPTATGFFSNEFHLLECDSSNSCQTLVVPISGTGVSVLAASPTSVDFGDVPLNTTASQKITFTIDKGYFVGEEIGSGSTDFAFDFDTCGFFVGPGTCTVKQSFTPTVTGPVSASFFMIECPGSFGNCNAITPGKIEGGFVSLSGTGVSPLAITTASLPSATVGTTYPVTALQAGGGTPPVTWSVSAGSLPTGLTLDPSTGTISGTPTVPGVFNFSVTATDSGTPTPQIATRSLSITIIGFADLAVSIAATSKPGPVSKPLSITIIVQNLGPNATNVFATDALPSASQFVSASTSQGSCTTPPVGTTGTMICSLGALATGATATIVVVVQPTIKKGTISDTATVAPDSINIDPVSANNTATVTAQIK